MAGKIGVQNIVEVLNLIDRMATILDDCLEDGKIGVWDLPKLLPIWPDLFDAVTDCDQIGAEVKDLDRDELLALGEQAALIVTKYALIFGKKK